jgi:hypothetical protein
VSSPSVRTPCVPKDSAAARATSFCVALSDVIPPEAPFCGGAHQETVAARAGTGCALGSSFCVPPEGVHSPGSGLTCAFAAERCWRSVPASAPTCSCTCVGPCTGVAQVSPLRVRATRERHFDDTRGVLAASQWLHGVVSVSLPVRLGDTTGALSISGAGLCL